MAIDFPPDTASNVDRVRWAFEQLNRHDVEPLRRFWTAETVERFPDRTCVGADEIAAYFKDLLRALPDYHMEVRSIVGEGDDVFVHWHLTGTHEGAFMGLTPTGKRIAVDGMDHFVIRDGKAVSNFVVLDQMQFARQIGMLPADGSAGDRAAKAAFNARTRVARRLKR